MAIYVYVLFTSHLEDKLYQKEEGWGDLEDHPMIGRRKRTMSRSAPSASLFSADERAAFHRDGFIVKPNIISPADATLLADHYSDLFAGRFPSGIYPDEWHWRENLSLPTAVREIVNGWKTSPMVARIALSPSLGRAAADLLEWKRGARLAQDDVLWKPPGASGVSYHTDGKYISDNFVPRDDNSVTVWIALDDADEAKVRVWLSGNPEWVTEQGVTSWVSDL